MDLQKAKKAAHQAAAAAFISGGITLLFIVSGLFTELDEKFKHISDPSNLLDVAIIVGFGIGLLRYSRAAAIGAFVYFIIARIHFALLTGQRSGMGIALIFLYFFYKGIRGTFAYHKIQRQENPDYRPPQRWTYIVGIPAGLLLLLLSIVGLLTTTKTFPPNKILIGDEIPTKYVQFLVDQGIVEPDETVLMFYSAGMTSIAVDGNLLTDRRVISYEETDGELKVYSARYEDIIEINLAEQGGPLTDAILEIWTGEDSGFRLLLSVEDDRDKAFISMLREKTGLVQPNAL